MTVMDEEVMTVEEVAIFLKVSKSWVYAAAERGEIPSMKFGHRHLRFLKSELVQWMRTRVSG